MKMKKCFIKTVLLLMAIVVIPFNIALASTEADVLQVYITEQTMTLFINQELRSNELQILVSNQNAEITATGSLADDGVLIRTTLLLNVSTSMPSVTRERIIELLDQIVARKLPHEEFRLVTFGEELITLQDFTIDRFDLASAIREVDFTHSQSRVYEAIFNTIPDITSVGDRPTFHRTIVITYGADNTAAGITREELFMRLQSDSYPVDVLSVGGRYSVENRELAAIARISNGRYFSLNANANVPGLVDWIGAHRFFYVEATVPSSLLDGVTRQVDISDSLSNISVDVRFPVFGAAPDTNLSEDHYESAEMSNNEPVIPITEDVTSNEDATTSGEFHIVIFIGGGIGLFILLAVIITILVIRSKKTNHSPPEQEAPYQNNSGAKTEFIGDDDFDDTNFTIKISSRSKTWTINVTGEVLIGRADHCVIQLDDKSVAREQCKIFASGSGLAVANLSETNKTSLNGKNVTVNSPLQSGDTLKFGREVLNVDYIQSLGAAPPKSEKRGNSNKGNTEAIF